MPSDWNTLADCQTSQGLARPLRATRPRKDASDWFREAPRRQSQVGSLSRLGHDRPSPLGAKIDTCVSIGRWVRKAYLSRGGEQKAATPDSPENVSKSSSNNTTLACTLLKGWDRWCAQLAVACPHDGPCQQGFEHEQVLLVGCPGSSCGDGLQRHS